MQEKWNQFVYDLIESKTKNVEEDPYHALIENQIWKEAKLTRLILPA